MERSTAKQPTSCDGYSEERMILHDTRTSDATNKIPAVDNVLRGNTLPFRNEAP